MSNCRGLHQQIKLIVDTSYRTRIRDSIVAYVGYLFVEIKVNFEEKLSTNPLKAWKIPVW